MDTILTANLLDNNYQLKITDASNNIMQIDLPIEQGGQGSGMRPMQTILAALIGCSNVDVISILKKQKQSFETLTIKVGGQRESGSEIAVWKKIHLTFEATGTVEPSKLYRAVDLSLEKYCSVAETLRRAGAIITFTIMVNNTSYQPA